MGGVEACVTFCYVNVDRLGQRDDIEIMVTIKNIITVGRTNTKWKRYYKLEDQKTYFAVFLFHSSSSCHNYNHSRKKLRGIFT
jgi:hypothetical protein